MLEIIGFEGCFNAGAIWSCGPSAIRKDDTIYNAVLKTPISEKSWKQCLEKFSAVEIPEPVEIKRADVQFKDWSGRANSPYVLAYHFNEGVTHILIDKALKRDELVFDGEFDALKNEGSRFLVFRNKKAFKDFGERLADETLDYLADASEDELCHWHNLLTIVSGLNLFDLRIQDLRRKVLVALHNKYSRKK